MLVAPKYTEDFRTRELARGRRSLFYFGVSILGFSAYSQETKRHEISAIHRDLAHFLEGRPPHHPWNRALVCMFRGAGKSVWTTQAYPMWRCLYIPNFSVKIIENSADNAKRHHFIPLVDLFTTSPRADYLQWLYEHRIPSGFTGWTTEQIKLVQTDPLANPAITYWGVESKFEGAHPNLVIGDDLEGADANKSVAANEEAWTAYQSVIPLLKHPEHSQVLIVGTPHGQLPLVWRLRDREVKETGARQRDREHVTWSSDADNAWSDFKIFWRPVLDGSGNSAWPERLSNARLKKLAREDIFDQQYMLRRTTSSLTLFDMEKVLGGGQPNDEGTCYSVLHDTARRVAIYPGFDYDPGALSIDPTYSLPDPVARYADLSTLRYYMHFDPLHKALAARKDGSRKKRPAQSAIVVVGITDDYHALCSDYWHGDADIDGQIDQLFRMYRQWAPVMVTYEGVGAQTWLLAFVKARERLSDFWRSPTSTPHLGTPLSLPRMSARMVEADKSNETKEWVYREVLGSWVNRGLLHFRRDQHEIIHQLANVLNQGEFCDLVDCLAQGPRVWVPPVAADRLARKYQRYVAKVNAKLAGLAGSGGGAAWARRSGYAAPWQGRGDEGA